MRKGIASLLDEAKGKMSGYVALINYRYMNLCVKAEPVSLLSISVEMGADKFQLEQLVNVTMPQEDQLALYPNSSDATTVYAICKGVKLTHPEFKVEVKNLDEEETDEEEGEKYILLTMPEIDKDRHDLITNGIDTLQKACQAKLDIVLQEYTQRMVLKLKDAKPEEIDEAKDMVQGLYDRHKEMLETFTNNKNNEVEEAYQRYQEEQEAKEKDKEEEDAAHNESAGMSMNLDED